jgi:hypothetical protein
VWWRQVVWNVGTRLHGTTTRKTAIGIEKNLVPLVALKGKEVENESAQYREPIFLLTEDSYDHTYVKQNKYSYMYTSCDTGGDTRAGTNSDTCAHTCEPTFSSAVCFRQLTFAAPNDLFRCLSVPMERLLKSLCWFVARNSSAAERTCMKCGTGSSTKICRCVPILVRIGQQ